MTQLTAHPKAGGSRRLGFLDVLMIAVALLIVLPAPRASAVGETPAQTFYLSMPEDEVRTAFLAIDTGNGSLSNTMVSITSIAVTVDGTIIYYDHWEDGYEAESTTPVQTSTQVFGDGNLANGNACAYVGTASLCTNDVLKAGAVLELRNDVPSNPRGTNFTFDAKDKVAVTEVVAVTRALWDSTVGTVLAGALQVYDTAGYGTDFRLPVGECATGLSQIRYPSSDVAVGSWTTRNPTTPATNYDKIDDPAGSPDDGTSYIVGTGGTEYQAASAAPTVPANATNISVSIVWRASDNGASGTSTVRPRLSVNGTYYDGGEQDIPGSWTTYTETWANNPAGGAWTPATVNTVNGLAFDATDSSPNPRITQGYIQVTYGVCNDPYQMFEYASAFIMAENDGTIVSIDSDGDGDVDFTANLDAGESYMLSSTASGVNLLSNAHITSNLPIQVNMITGDIDSSNKYENRWFNIPPTNLWGGSYVTPVASPNTISPSNVFIYNPDQANSITVSAETSSGTTSFTVGPGATYQYTMPVGSGARFHTATGAEFLAIGTVDSANASGDDGRTWDWGYTLIAEEQLAPALAVGWAPGSNALPPANNGSPVYVSAAAATTVYVDYDGDPTTGPNTVDIGGVIYHYDTSQSVSALQAIKIYDPDNNQTGMRVFTADGTLLAAAWGEDPAVAGTGNPYLDMGYVLFPLPQMSVTKNGVLDVAATAPTDEANVGDVINYTITAKNTGARTLTNVTLVDPKLGVLTCTPAQPATLAAGASMVCTASYTLTQADIEAGVVYNTATGDSDQTPPRNATEEVKIPKLAVIKTASPTAVPETGGDVTFTFTVKNNNSVESGVSLKILSLSDSVFGALTGDADCQVGTVLAPQASCEFSIVRRVAGDFSGTDHVNVFTTVAEDADGTDVSANNDATVTFLSAVIKVRKVTVPAGVGPEFTFTIDPLAQTNAGGPFTRNSRTNQDFGDPLFPVIKVDPGSYTITETGPSINQTNGWNLTDVACTGGTGWNDWTGFGDTTISGSVAAGDVVECTFTNQPDSPLGVTLGGFAVHAQGSSVMVDWETVSEQDTAGFNLYRGPTEQGPWSLVNPSLIAAQTPGSASGASYTWVDEAPDLAGSAWYLLEDVTMSDVTTRYAPVEVVLAEPNAIEISGLSATRSVRWVNLAVFGGLTVLGLGLTKRRMKR